MDRMSEKELSKLSYIIAAIVNDPTHYKSILLLHERGVRMGMLLQPSPALDKAFKALRIACSSDLNSSSDRLSKSKDPIERQVGLSLQWFLQERNSS